MVTKGYGFSVDDIDWSCPADLEPYEKAYEMERRERDSENWLMLGSYLIDAVALGTRRGHPFSKKEISYPKKPYLIKAYEDSKLTQEEKDEREIRKMILAEEQWISVHKQHGLKETKIK